MLRCYQYGGTIHDEHTQYHLCPLSSLGEEERASTCARIRGADSFFRLANAAVLARTATDLTFFSPFATCLFYAAQGTMEARPFRTPAIPDAPQGIYERLEERLWPTVQKQWAVFGPANLINLSVVPLYARPPYINVIPIGWNPFLASAQSRGGLTPEEALSRDILIAAAEVME